METRLVGENHSECFCLISYRCNTTFVLMLLMHCAAAMLAYKTISGTKSLKKLVHLTLQLIALCLSLIGVWAAIKFHNDKGIDNFYSLHSWLGLACLFLFTIQVITLFPSHLFHII